MLYKQKSSISEEEKNLMSRVNHIIILRMSSFLQNITKHTKKEGHIANS